MNSSSSLDIHPLLAVSYLRASLFIHVMQSPICVQEFARSCISVLLSVVAKTEFAIARPKDKARGIFKGRLV